MKTEIKRLYVYSWWNRLKVQWHCLWHLHRMAILNFECGNKYVTCFTCNKKLEVFINDLKKAGKQGDDV